MKETSVITRKQAVFTVLAAAAIILLLTGLRWYWPAKDDLKTTEGREKFLADLGWQIDTESESYKSVLLPEKLEGPLAEYNLMQREQGCDLGAHLGEECEQFSYIVTNYPDSEAVVYITLYIQGNELIAADVHSTAIDGFMHGIFREKT